MDVDSLRPATSPARSLQSPPLHASHAMMMQINEYRSRVRMAVASTYQCALLPPALPSSRPVSSSLASSSHRPFPSDQRDQLAVTNVSYSGASRAKDAVMPRKSSGYVAFHKMQARRGEFLLGEGADRRAARMLAGASSVSTPSGIAKDHFALGPGQYDVCSPSSSKFGAKFSPADRFRDDFTAGEKPGPGQYVTHSGDALVSPRAAAAVFSQVPRRTDESLILPNAELNQQPTRPHEADRVEGGCGRTGYPAASSYYYYQPSSGFAPKYDKQNDRESWSRAPRFNGRHRWHRMSKSDKGKAEGKDAINFVAQNKRRIHTQAAVQRVLRARGALNDREPPLSPNSASYHPPVAFKRRESLFLSGDMAALVSRDFDGDGIEEEYDIEDYGEEVTENYQATPLEAPLGITKGAVNGANTVSQQSYNIYRGRSSVSTNSVSPSGAVTALIAATSRRNSNATAPSRSHYASFVDTSQQVFGWSTVCVLASFPKLLAHRFRIAKAACSVQRAHNIHCMRQALGSWKLLNKHTHELYARALIAKNAFRYRFKLRVERKNRQAMLLREFLGGLSMEVRFALAMKRLKRKVVVLQRWWRHAQLMVRARELALFYKWVSVEARLRLEYLNQLPHLHRIFQPPRQASPRRSSITSATVIQEDRSSDSSLPLHRLLNLPEQRAWFPARFTLTADGVLRAIDIEGAEIMIEFRGFRCHLHEDGFDDEHTSPNDQDNDTHTSTARRKPKWQPYVMLFRPSTFRFVLLSSSATVTTPNELHEWMAKLERVSPSSNGATSGSGRASVSVRELVDVTMQSGILSTPRNGSERMVAASPSPNSANTLPISTASPRGKLQARVRSIRQSRGSRIGAIGLSSTALGTTGVSPVVFEGEMRYYVVDLLKDLPKVPQREIWQAVRDKLRDKRKQFRAEIHRFKLESAHYRAHQDQVSGLRVPDKFRDFFVSPLSCCLDCGFGSF